MRKRHAGLTKDEFAQWAQDEANGLRAFVGLASALALTLFVAGVAAATILLVVR
jgi:hypothetical protein